MRKAKQQLLVSLAIFAVAFASVIVLIAANASGTVQTLGQQIKRSEAQQVVPVQTVNAEVPQSTVNQPPESAPDAPKSVQTYQHAVVTPNAEQEQQAPVEMERIPFTDKPVTAGDPESYVDTYGQCPFYENAGPKGCYPPADIQCNEDWSKCEYIGVKQ